MTDRESRSLATRIAKESRGVRIKFGRTNGSPRLHLVGDRASLTICEPWEWADHPWNAENKPREARAVA